MLLQFPCSFHNFTVSIPPSPTALLRLYINLLLIPQCIQKQIWWKTTWAFNLKVQQQQQHQHSFSEQDCPQLSDNSSTTGKALSKDMSHYDAIIPGGCSFSAPTSFSDTSSFPQNDKFCCRPLYTGTTRTLEDTCQKIDDLGSSLRTCICNVLLKLAF